MYAVIASGGKQYRVTVGQILKLEKLDVAEGDDVTFDQVLMVSDGEDIRIGQPLLKGVVVKGTVLAQARDKKVNIIKFRRRKHSMKRMGHRQDITQVEIIQVDKVKKAAGKPMAKQSDTKKSAAKKSEAKPVAKKTEAKSVAEKSATKPAAKKAEKPAAKKVEKPATKKAAKPSAEKSEAKKKPVAKKPAAKKAGGDKKD